MIIFLTKNARKNYQSIIFILKREWGNKVAKEFEYITGDFLSLLANYPQIGVVEVREKEIRSFQLTRQIRIFYRIKPDRIIILSFFDVRQNPIKKPK
jgi:plasmid stabilization system protein ParE